MFQYFNLGLAKVDACSARVPDTEKREFDVQRTAQKSARTRGDYRPARRIHEYRERNTPARARERKFMASIVFAGREYFTAK